MTLKLDFKSGFVKLIGNTPSINLGIKKSQISIKIFLLIFYRNKIATKTIIVY